MSGHIKTTRGAPKNPDRPWQDEELVRELYHEKLLSPKEIAERFDCSPFTMYRWIDRHDIEKRDRIDIATRAKRKKPPSHRWNKDGYEVVETTVDGTTKSARIHRLVVVAHGGFDAIDGKDVHHKNGVKWDNRPENLEPMTRSEHAKHHRPIDHRWGER